MNFLLINGENLSIGQKLELSIAYGLYIMLVVTAMDATGLALQFWIYPIKLFESIFAALLAFIGEPLAEWYEIYFVLHWYHIWSLPIYLIKTVIGKWLIEKLISLR